MFTKKSNDGFKEMFDGINFKTLVYGEKTLMTEFRMKAGSALPRHSHPHEQIGYLISGRIAFTIDGKQYLAEPGDSWCIHGGCPIPPRPWKMRS